MKNLLNISLFFIVLILLFGTSCNNKPVEPADLIIKGGTIYTVNENNPTVEAVVVSGNKIIFVGKEIKALDFKGKNTKIIDLGTKVMIPGFIDSHGHFSGMGRSKLILDLTKTESFEDLLTVVEDAVKKAKPDEWIVGRGWHQDKWSGEKSDFIAGFPVHKRLSAISPDNPVFLTHASGHSSLVNAKALKLAGITKSKVKELINSIEGGEIMLDSDGEPTGILNENAENLILDVMPEDDDKERLNKIFDLAVEECHKNGITGFHDAGILQKTIDQYKKYKKEGKLKIRIHAMLYNDSSLLKEWFKKGPYIDSIDYLLNIRTVKLLADGALGNRGAWLLEDYSDKPGWRGLETVSMDYVQEIAEKCLEHGFQLSIHAIGDRANREVLNRYEAAFKLHSEKSKDHRFRIEHAQHLSLEDIPRFAKLGVLAAMQTIHMSSDRPWAIDRLGEKRIKEGAYVWQKLWTSGAHIMNGTDVPVEPVNPIACFYAAVTRKTLKGTPDNGYEPDQKLTREQALKTYTINGAYGSFEENIKGSIEVGKLADFAILDKDIMKIPENDILNTKVVMTIFDGKIVYEIK